MIMQRHSSLLILLVLLLFTTSSTAQPYILQHLSIEDGLSNNYVQDIAQDKRGCIWIATVLGLNRFDGLKFTTYKSTNSKLGNDALNALLYDEEEDELTMVRKLKGYQEVLVIIGIIVWTVVVGYFISGLDIATDFYNNKTLETAIIYIDACASAVGIANGLFIFFRLREQWIAWYICAFLEAVINIMSGQYVLLPLKLGYFTNTTYGYIKWSRYIKEHQNKEKVSLF